MIKQPIYIISLFMFFLSCGKKETKPVEKHDPPVASNNGLNITFPDEESFSFFKTETIGSSNMEGAIITPGNVAATVLPSSQGASQNIILFNNPDLAAHYSQLIQHQTNISQIQGVTIKQKQLELQRTEDLLAHGAVTGQDLINIQTELAIERNNLANEKTSLIEHESQLKSGGFDPKVLRNAKAQTAYVVCDIPENQIGQISEGQTCEIVFTAFPSETIKGKVDAIADIVNSQTRMVKVRITVANPSNKIKSGMYAKVSFDVEKGDIISIPNASLVTVKGKHYVFVKASSNEFERKQVQIGEHMGGRVLVFDGLENGDEIVVEGVMQLKGLSFGY